MKNLIILIVSFFSLATYAQSPEVEKIQIVVEYLADDKLKGRETGTEGEDLAAKFIVKQFEMLGLEAKGEGGYYQNFSVTPKANPHGTKVDNTKAPIIGKNVVAYLDHGAKYTVIFGAHYDHLGVGAFGSLYAGKVAQIHNGADDNASGVALMLSLADKLGADEFKKFNYLFIGFSGEEKGLWGSNYYSKNPTIDLSTVSYMINFDMVGRLDEEKGLAINGVGTATNWMDDLNAINKDSLKLITSESGVGPSDHTSFYLVDIPVLHFFTGQHSDYHKPTDDAEKVNYEGIAYLSGMISDLVIQTEAEEKLTFQKTKTEESETPRFKVTLGVMPDYMYQGDGMRIDGVTEGRPASKAGFQKGDVVIQMGEHQVEDMMGYMKALSRFQKGDKTKVKVKRGEEIVEEEVTF